MREVHDSQTSGAACLMASNCRGAYGAVGFGEHHYYYNNSLPGDCTANLGCTPYFSVKGISVEAVKGGENDKLISVDS